MRIANPIPTFDDKWSADFIKRQIEKIDELLKEYPDSDTYKYVRSVWVERLGKYESGN